MLNVGPGKPPVPAAALKGFTVGPTKGLTIKLPSGGTRLMIPGENEWSASVYSDDHGKTVSPAAPVFSSSAGVSKQLLLLLSGTPMLATAA